MRNFFRLGLILMMVCAMAFSAGAEGMILINEELEPKTQVETLAMLASVIDGYFQDPAIYAELNEEITRTELKDPFGEDENMVLNICTLTHQGQTMRFLMDQIGDADENGRYPLYITLHGGGEDAPENNDGQWFSMYDYYRESVQSGIYIACRGITDTWDLHFRPESYPLYDRLIQAMIYLYHADPDRVYLLGFSAGGDGVYQITPRMTDRFAAANMSSGHPNGISLLNLANCPFSIQVGVRDYYTENVLRCIRGAEFEKVLSDYHDEYGFGYEHQVLVHVPAGHNYDDYTDPELYELTAEQAESMASEVLADPTAYADPSIVEGMMEQFEQAMESTTGTYSISNLSYYSEGLTPAFDEAVRKIVKEDYQLETKRVNASAVHYVSQFTRKSAPETVIWDLNTRAALRDVTSFYWLKADASVTQGTIVASIDSDNNTVTVTPENVNGDFSILVNPTLLDVSQPIHIETPDGSFEVMVHPSEETMLASLMETGDPFLTWVAEIPYSLLQ